MQIGSGYQTQNIWDMNYISDISNANKSESLIESDRKGDTVEISSEARELFSQMIHKYDRPTASGESDAQSDADSAGGEGASGGEGAAGGPQGAGGGGSADSADSIENIKKQIQALKSQLMSLTSGMGSGADEAAMSQINTINGQIAALEAELQAMQAAAG